MWMPCGDVDKFHGLSVQIATIPNYYYRDFSQKAGRYSFSRDHIVLQVAAVYSYAKSGEAEKVAFLYIL